MKAGDLVGIETAHNNYEGIVMPNPDKNVLFLKLKNGYNLGIKREEIKRIRIIKQAERKKEEQKEGHLQKTALKTISIIHTGGTIASKVDYETGAVISRFRPEEIVAQFPELRGIANIRSRLLRQMFSEDMRFAHYNLIAREIEKEIKSGAEGIIVTHGTDTMHYTAAALSFIFEELPVPVILVGAQRSSDRGSSDAAMNLICSARFIAKTDFADVGICMHKNMDDDICIILPGTKARKLHTSRRDAFKAVNGEHIAEIDYKNGEIKFISTSYKKRDSKRKVELKLFKESLKLGILKSHPQMFASEVLMYKGFDGLVLEGTGLAGNFPINEIDEDTKEHSRIYEELKKLAKKIPVAATSQCIFGRINMNVYSTGRKLQEIGIIGNLLDITAETAFIKLAWLLSNYPKQVKELFGKNLRGEISERTGQEFLG